MSVTRASAALLVLVALTHAGAAQTVSPELGPPLPGPRMRNIPNLKLLAAPRDNAGASEATHEGKEYWKARRAEGARKAETALPPDYLRKAAEAVYEERLAERRARGPLAAAGWRSLGPTTHAGRVMDYEFTPDGSKLYVATANGGIWLLTRQGGPGSDYGNPRPLTDDLPLLTFGAVAVAPSNPSIVYAATGEAIRGSDTVSGLGTLRSTDGGTTWRFNTQSVSGGYSSLIPGQKSYDLDVHPQNPNDVLLASDRGIFRSLDGGATWVSKLEARSDGTRQCVNLRRRPDDPSTLFAGLWGGLGESHDGGETWSVYFTDIAEQLELPGWTPIRSLVAIAPSNPNRIYWFVAADTPDAYSQIGIFRSDNGGQTFRTALGPPREGQEGYPLIAGKQGWAFLGIAVDPTNPDRVIAGGLDTWRSEDGGVTWTQIADWHLPEKHPQHCHADVNAIAFEPRSSVFWMGTDGGLFRSVDGGRSFIWKNDGVVARMFSSLAQHPTDRYRLYAGTQDNGTMRLNGNSPSAWKKINYGDGFDCAVNHQDPNIVYVTTYNNWTRVATDGGESQDSFTTINCPDDYESYDECQLPPVTTFRSRLGIWKSDPRSLLAMTDTIYYTTRGGLNDKGEADPSDWKRIFRGYFCRDGYSLEKDCSDEGGRYAGCSAIGIHPNDDARQALATSSGYVVYTLNDFESTSILPVGSAVNTIAWDPDVSNAFYIGLESPIALTGNVAHSVYYVSNLSNDPNTRVFTPADAGMGVVVSHAGGFSALQPPIDALAISPVDSSLMFAGSKYGIYRSTNGGSTWARFGDDFPATWVSALLFTPDGSLLRAATWGRGMWEINPLGGPPVATTPPTAGFNFSPAAPRPGQVVSFSDQSSGGASQWSWSFGDGGTSNEQNPTHVYAAPGTYTVGLTVANAAGSRSTTKSVTVSFGTTGTGDAFTYLFPVVLTSSGAGGAFFTTELVMTNRSGRTLNLTFRAKGTFEGSSTYSMPPGQEIRDDVFAFLRQFTGMNVPGGNVITSLRIEVRGADNLTQFGALVRVTTPPGPALPGTGGRFGLSFPAVPLGRGARDQAVVYGLQQTSDPPTPGTRSNLACVNAGTGTSGQPLVLEVAYTFTPIDSYVGAEHAQKDRLTLSPFQFSQINTPLATRGLIGGAFATIRRVSGDDQFVCYGVLNDNVNSDGAFVPMVMADQTSPTPNAVVPVIVDTAGFRSEMTFANRTPRRISCLLAIIRSDTAIPEWGYYDFEPYEQSSFEDIMADLREGGFDTPAGTVASVFVQFLEGTYDGQSDTQPPIPSTEGYVGVRTYAERDGGKLGLAYGYSPVGTAADTEAYIYGLQQTGQRGVSAGTRANLAVVHALGGNVEPLTLEVTYFGPNGAEIGREAPVTLQAGQWMQFNAPLARFGVPHGFARIRRISGSDQFLAYGVLNDQLNDDGSYAPMIVP